MWSLFLSASVWNQRLIVLKITENFKLKIGLCYHCKRNVSHASMEGLTGIATVSKRGAYNPFCMKWINVNRMNFPQKNCRKCVRPWWLHLLSFGKTEALPTRFLLWSKKIFLSLPNHKGFAIKMMKSKDIKTYSLTLLELGKFSVSTSNVCANWHAEVNLFES